VQGALRERGGAVPGGRGSRWAGRAVCAAAGAFKPGLAGSHGAFAVRELTGRVPLSSSSAPRVPALATPALLDSAPPTWAMPRYELALILKAMRRVSDLPSDRVPARARPAASRPPSPACPACWTPGPLARCAGGRGRKVGGWRVGQALGAAACAREAGGVYARACARSREGVCRAGGGAGLGPRLSGVRWKDCGRTHAREPRPAPLCAHASRSCSSSPPAAGPDRLPSASAISYSLPPKPASAGCVPTHLSPLSHQKEKKNLLTFLFLTPAEILLRVPLAQFYSSKLWPCLCFRRHAFPQLLIDLEVGTFRFGGMINHQQPGHGLGSAAGGGSYVLSQSVVAEIPILLREFGNVVCFHALSFPSRYSLKENKSNRCPFFERLEAAFF
jgi:hypothetical protein